MSRNRLVASKCIPVLLYGLVACPLNKTQLSSLDFLMNRFLMKLFSTSNMEIITYCREQFDLELPSVILARHTSLFLDKLRHCDNILDKIMLCILKGTLHSVEKNPYTEGLLCLLLHSEGTAIFLCRLTA